MVSLKYATLVAKREKDNASKWLPLWIHLRDTSEIMKRLIAKWVPESVIGSSGLDNDNFMKVAVFLAGVHDIGKATSHFQNIICDGQSAWMEIINESGLKVINNNLHIGKTPHAYAGEWITQSDNVGINLPKSISEVIGAHHGKPFSEGIGENDLVEIYPTSFYGELDENSINNWKEVWKGIVKNALSLAGINSQEELPEISLEAQVLLSGLLITADWIASNTNYFPLIDYYIKADENIYPDRVNRGWEKCHFPEGWMPEVNFMDQDTFQNRFGFYPNEVQKELLEVVNTCKKPGIIILEAQMGCGKTEAALGAAEVIAKNKENSGIFFGLPTQATSNGIYGRLLDWAVSVSEDTENSIKLAHGGASFNKEYQKQVEEGRALVDDEIYDYSNDGVTAHPWFQGNKRALLADFVIGTVDQFLMAALKRKHFMMRHLGLSGKVVVIDECHAYDAYMNQYLDCAIAWMARYNVTVILLSATLPIKRRQELVDAYVKSYKSKQGIKQFKKKSDQDDWRINIGYPLITWTEGGSVQQKIVKQEIPYKKVHNIYLDKSALIDKLNEGLKDGGCACIIANTVKNAQYYYDALKSYSDDFDIMLYHAQYMMPDRVKKEEQILKRMGKNSKNEERNKFILIGTQVLEQSLDYDADVLFTELCPMDLYMQRIGRLHRHNRSFEENHYSRPTKLKEPNCYILVDGEEGKNIYDSGSSTVYGDYLLMRTHKIMPSSIEIPRDIPRLVNEVYNFENDFGLENNDEYNKAKEKNQLLLSKKQAKAEMFLLEIPRINISIEGILDNDCDTNERNAEATVRDTGSTIEVLLMKQTRNDKVTFIDDAIEIDKDKELLGDIAYEIAKQRIRLPGVFSSPWMIDKTISELEKRQNEIKEWQKSSWIQGELVLLLDTNERTELCGYIISYSSEKGLIYEKEGGNNIE